jgi:hypothetical protein
MRGLVGFINLLEFIVRRGATTVSPDLLGGHAPQIV